MNGDRAPVSRCFMVWLLVSLGCAVTTRLLVNDVAAPAPSFDVLLPHVAGAVLIGCAGWFWWVTTWTALAAVSGAGWAAPGCPRGLQRAILAACGVALVGVGPAALADPPTHPGPSIIAGLPLPERASGTEAMPASLTRAPAAPSPQVVVRAGDTLWDLAADVLPADASDARITRAWHALYAANRNVLDDPDLIYPGTRLTRPTQEDS